MFIPPKRLFLFILALIIGFHPSAYGQNNPLLVDVAEPIVALTTDFKGKKIFIFGTTSEPGDIVLTIRGPKMRRTLYQKTRHWGLWLNTQHVEFNHVASFYQLSSNRPLPDFMTTDELQKLRLGPEYQEWVVDDQASTPHQDHTLYYKEFLRRMRQQGLYPDPEVNITLIDNRLFYAKIELSSIVPTGIYSVDAYLIRDQHIIGHQETKLVVRKTGISAFLFDLANRSPWVYAILSLGVAVGCGLLYGTVIKRSR